MPDVPLQLTHTRGWEAILAESIGGLLHIGQRGPGDFFRRSCKMAVAEGQATWVPVGV